MGPGPRRGGRGGDWICLNVDPLNEPLNERETLTQGGHCNVATILAALVRERSNQVFGDEFQLCSRVVGRKACQYLKLGVTQTSWIGQKRHAGWDRCGHLLGCRQRARRRFAVACVE